MSTEQPSTSECGLTDRQRTIYKMKVAGHTLREIARALGISHVQVKRDFDEANAFLQRLEYEDLIVARDLALARLDAAIVVLMPKVRSGSLFAIDRLIAIEARRASLLGLDQPKRVEMTGKDGGAIETRLEDLRQKYTPEEATMKAQEMAQKVSLLTSEMAKTQHRQDHGSN